MDAGVPASRAKPTGAASTSLYRFTHRTALYPLAISLHTHTLYADAQRIKAQVLLRSTTGDGFTTQMMQLLVFIKCNLDFHFIGMGFINLQALIAY